MCQNLIKIGNSDTTEIEEFENLVERLTQAEINFSIQSNEREKLEKESRKSKSSSSTRSRRKGQHSDTQKAIIKALTSATVIRGVLGILGKMIK